MQFSIQSPEQEPKPLLFPCIRRGIVSGKVAVFFDECFGFVDGRKFHGVASEDTFPVAPGTTAKIKFTAGDGTEFPRIIKYNDRFRWLAINSAVAVFVDLNIEETCEYDVMYEWRENSYLESAVPLPTGTETTITISDGGNIELQEIAPDWLPVELENDQGGRVRLGRVEDTSFPNRLLLRVEDRFSDGAEVWLTATQADNLREHLDRFVDEDQSQIPF